MAKRRRKAKKSRRELGALIVIVLFGSSSIAYAVMYVVGGERNLNQGESKILNESESIELFISPTSILSAREEKILHELEKEYNISVEYRCIEERAGDTQLCISKYGYENYYISSYLRNRYKINTTPTLVLNRSVFLVGFTPKEEIVKKIGLRPNLSQ